MVKKKGKLMFVLPKFGSLQDGTSDLLKISDSQKLGKFFKLGVAIISHFLLTDFSLKKQKKLWYDLRLVRESN